MYTAYEEKNPNASRKCRDHLREFDISIRDNFNIEVARFHRPFKCDCCFNLLQCSLQELEVKAADGTIIGWVKQQKSCRSAVFHICDENENVILELRRDGACMCACGKNADFDVITSNGEHIGKVTKEWTNQAQEEYTDNDNFGIQFPIDLDVKCKAVILSSLFLIVSFLNFTSSDKYNLLGLHVL